MILAHVLHKAAAVFLKDMDPENLRPKRYFGFLGGSVAILAVALFLLCELPFCWMFDQVSSRVEACRIIKWPSSSDGVSAKNCS